MAIEADGRHHYPIQGIEIWKNQKNKFLVFQAHYTCDPDKRNEEYRKDKIANLPRRKYLMEYELHWESFSGLPVFGDTWNERLHSVKEELEPELGCPLLVGWDWGLTPAAVVCQIIGTRLNILREFVAVNMGAKRFISIVGKELSVLYPAWSNFQKDVLCFIDPSGRFRKDTDENTCANFLDQAGFKLIHDGAIAFEERRASVEQFLTGLEKGQARFQISAAFCPILIKGFNGGYQFKEGQDEIEPRKLEAEKNSYSHPMDALQMVCSRIMRMSLRSRANIPAPSYIWSTR